MPELSGEKIGEIFVEIKARTDSLEKELKVMRSKVEQSASALGKTFGKFFNQALSEFGAYLGVSQFLGYMKESISLAKEQAKAEKQVAQAIRQTGCSNERYKRSSCNANHRRHANDQHYLEKCPKKTGQESAQ